MKEQILKSFDSLMGHLNSEENGMAEEFREKLEALFATKTLYVLTSDGGDGSRGVHYTLNADFIGKLNDAYDSGQLDYDSLGCDGDGFGYDTIAVPAFATLASLTVSDCAHDDFEDEELEDEEDE